MVKSLPKTYIVFVGLPCSGKSTLAAALQETLYSSGIPNTVYSRDRLVEKFAEDEGVCYNTAFDYYRKIVDKQLKSNWQACLLSDIPVIVDMTNMTPSSRNKLFNNMKSGSRVLYVHFEGFAQEQLRERNAQGLKNIPFSAIAAMLKNYRKPTLDDHPTVKTIITLKACDFDPEVEAEKIKQWMESPDAF